MPDALDPVPLLRHLSENGVEHIIIGGFAVVAHGHVRPSKDLDIVPESSRENLERLVIALLAVNAADAEVGDFDPSELAMSATRIDDLLQGDNFRLTTDLGDLDIMQWASGVESDDLYSELNQQSLAGDIEGVAVEVCGLEHLLAMKRAAGRPQDLEDLNRLGAAEEPG
jgi:predicted nucleotidyltransferase